MTSLHKVTLLLKPSLVSGVAGSILTTIVISAVAWSHISSTGLFYDFLFGRTGVATALLFVPSNIFLQRNILNSPATYYVIIGAVAVMVGVLVYALLQGVGRMNQEAGIFAQELRTHDPHFKEAVYEDLVRLGVRLASLVAWLLYGIVFINVLWPFVVSLMQVGLTYIATSTVSGWLYVCAAVVLFAVSLHLHVTFVRLCTLRLRLFGGFIEE